MRLLIIFLMMGLGSPLVRAQGVVEREHPRVSELQDKLTDYVRGYLQTRLQGVPFMVTVKIDPIRRRPGSNYQPVNEKLPYFDLREEEIRDEWDDPSASLYVLQSRIQKATVLISLPRALKDAEVQEIRDSLTTLLRLIPGRDEIIVEERNWSLGANFWYYVFLASGLLVFMLLGLLFISRSWARKLATAIHEIKPKEKSDLESASSPIQLPTSVSGVSGPSSQDKLSGQDLKFRDPLKTREFVHSRIQELIKNPHFPNLQAMIEMDKLADSHSKDFGGLLVEFPHEVQKKIFALSFKPSWLNAFSEPGELTGASLELLDRLSRIQYHPSSSELFIEHSVELDQLLVQIWRMGNDRLQFIKNLNKEEALYILKSLPYSMAVPLARQAFPGGWAVLLDHENKVKPISEKRIKELIALSLVEKPLLDFSALERYKQEKDLLEYLQIADLQEEKDIYGALPQDSFLRQVRPPFFSVLESNDETLKKVFERVSLDEWALALFNVAREYRRPVEAFFNSKQKFLFTNKMRSIDQAGIDKRVMGQARERIAQIYHSILNDDIAEVLNDISSESVDKNDDNKMAA